MKLSKELIQAAETVFMAMAYTGAIRPIVEGYKQEIIEKYQFLIDSKWIGKSRSHYKEGAKVEGYKNAYLMSDEDFKIYLSEIVKKQDENGWHENSIKGTCPLLCAESLEREAKRELLRAAQYIIKIDADKQYIPMDKYKQLIDLTLTLCAPFIDSKKILADYKI
jgi:hypothetical protein